jgi:hypothetical protein
MTLTVTHEIAEGDAFLLSCEDADGHRVLLYDRSAQTVSEVDQPAVIQARTSSRGFRGKPEPILSEVAAILAASE